MNRQAKKMAERQAAGRCRVCGAPQAPGRGLCDAHLQVQRERKRLRDAAKKAAGRCVEGGCEQPAAGGHIRCAGCHAAFAAANLAWQREHRKRGVGAAGGVGR